MTTPVPSPSPPPRTASGDEALRAWLSDLADGEADAEAAQAASAAWRDSTQARQTWHAYHLIGDVLRSEELARPAAADARFLAGLRERLAHEPVVLAPAPLAVPQPVAAPRRQRWLAPAAVAAGFVAVAGVLVVTRLAVPEGGSGQPVLARSVPPAVAGNGLTLVTGGGGFGGLPAAAGGSMLRDPRLDAYINAHQSARGGSAAAVPGAVLRSVEVVASPAPAASTR
jgi:sigma-E factor negative regulatory protein RseA